MQNLTTKSISMYSLKKRYKDTEKVKKINIYQEITKY